MPGQVPVATRQFSDYNPQPDLTETAVQDAIPTESYDNSGLNGGRGPDGRSADVTAAGGTRDTSIRPAATGVPWQRRSNSRAADTERADIPVRRSSSGTISSGGPGFARSSA